MRITTRLKVITVATIAALIVLAPILISSFNEFSSAKSDYLLADRIQGNFFERASFRDLYFLYREDRKRALWDDNKAVSDQLLQQAKAQFRRREDQQTLEQVRQNIEDTAGIFHRIVSNTTLLNTASDRYQVHAELDKRLYSQLLLKATAVRETITTLQNAGAQRIEQAYERLVLYIGLFGITLALAVILTSLQIGSLIRKRLRPLHEGASIVAGGDLTYRIECDGHDEFSELASSINTMTDSLQASSQQLKAEVRAHQQVADLLRKLSIAIEQSPASVVITDVDACIEYVNSRFTTVTGYLAAEVIGQNPRILQSGQTVKETYPELWGKLTGGQVWHGELLNKRKNGVFYWEDVSIAPVKNPAGVVTHYVAVKIDISERKRTEEQIRELNRNFVSFLENTSDFIYFKDEKSRFRFCSQTLATITGHESWRDMIGKHDLEVFPPETAKIYHEEEVQVFGEGKPLLNKVNPYLDAAGNQGWVSTNKWPLLDHSGKVVGLFGISRDVTEHKRMEDQVRQLAFYDPLTHLPNRRMLNDRLIQAIAANKRSGNHGAMMFLDLDNFKPLNDRHGHDVGDLLLIEVANRLKSCVREVDTVARFGGDEFVVMLSDLSADRAESLSNSESVAEKIRFALSEPYSLRIEHVGPVQTSVEHHCTASIGVALFGNTEASPDDILKWADAAMYEAKDAGRNCIRFHAAKESVTA